VSEYDEQDFIYDPVVNDLRSVSSTLDELIAFGGDTSEYKEHRYMEDGKDDYRCNECSKSFSKRANRRTHQQSKHEDVVYSCDQCEYKATQQGHLKTHQQSKHDGVRYSCDQCEYQALT
jgi:DNA-directed RNA polymerase subunit RPC12/RpoP